MPAVDTRTQKQAQGKQLRNTWSGLCLGAGSDKPFAVVQVLCKQRNRSTWAMSSLMVGRAASASSGAACADPQRHDEAGLHMI